MPAPSRWSLRPHQRQPAQRWLSQTHPHLQPWMKSLYVPCQVLSKMLALSHSFRSLRVRNGSCQRPSLSKINFRACPVPAFLVCLFAVLAPVGARAHEPMAQDSIVIDGVMLDVEAQVRFDSLPTDSRNITATFQAAWTFNTFLGGGRSAPGWWNWSGRPDVNFQCSAELLRLPARPGSPQTPPSGKHFDAGFMVASLVSIDASTFPDSLIGFTGRRRLRFAW